MGGSGLQHARRLSMFCYYFQATPGSFGIKPSGEKSAPPPLGSWQEPSFAVCSGCTISWRYGNGIRDGRLESAGGKNQNKIGG